MDEFIYYTNLASTITNSINSETDDKHNHNKTINSNVKANTAKEELQKMHHETMKSEFDEAGY